MEKMGGILSYFWSNTGRTDDPDPVTGLTSRDKFILTSTWAKLNNADTGMTIFLNLFEKYPQYHQLFPFRNIPRDQLRSNARFKAHCVSLMYALTGIIDNIQSPALMEQLLLKQGVSHIPRGVPTHAYEELKKVLMDLFAKSLNEEELKTWNAFLDLGFSIIVKGAESADAK